MVSSEPSPSSLSSPAPSTLTLPRLVWAQMVGHAYDGLPDEACGLLLGDPGSTKVGGFYPCRNAAASSRVYNVDPQDYLRADKVARQQRWDLVGVMHSHTHTEAYPSPTDVEAAPDPDWHYVIVSLRAEAPVLRSYRIVDRTITEELVGLADR